MSSFTNKRNHAFDHSEAASNVAPWQYKKNEKLRLKELYKYHIKISLYASHERMTKINKNNTVTLC